MRSIIARLITVYTIILLPFLISCSGSGGGENGEFIPNPPVSIPAGAERWSDPQTWEGHRPKAGEVATIPKGKVVALDEDPPALAGVEVNGTLIFARRDTKLRAGWITVNGKLEVGAEADPFTHRVVITLNGRPGSDPQGREGGIWVLSGGTIDLHGEAGRLSWTRLAQTAHAGANQLVLQATPVWRAGDRIVIASTDFDMNQAEEKEVVAVDGSTVTLNSPLAYTHWGATESGVEERAEVGLISRNILIQGDEESTQDGMGGHLRATFGSTMRISGVEFYRMGRKGELGDYPVHFHMMGDATGSFIKESAVHHSYNRAVTIHGSHKTVVKGNVVYDTLGHSYFFEDGIETDNLLENNMGLLTRVPPADFRILASDADPATFWVSNPDNILRGNVAAGSARFGFWFDLSLHPTGPSTTETVFPRNTPLGEFNNNVAHSNGENGLFVDQRGGVGLYSPRSDGQPNGVPAWASFNDFIAYKNRTRGIWIRGDHVVVQRVILADNETGITFASKVMVKYPNLLKDSLVVGETSNKGTPRPGEKTGVDGRTLSHPTNPGRPIRGFEYYDGLIGVENVSFHNFQSNSQRKAGALGDFRYDQYPLDPGNYSNAITFVNANQIYFDPFGADPLRPDDEDGHRSAVFLDRDGSVTGTAGNSVVVNNPFMIDAACIFMGEWNAYVSPHGYGGLVIYNNDVPPTAITPLRITREDGGAVQNLMGIPGTQRFRFHTNLLNKRNYVVAFGGPVPNKIRLEYINRQGGDWVKLAVPYPYPLFSVYRDGYLTTSLAAVNTLAEVGAGSGNVYYYDATNQMLHIKLVVRSDVVGRDFARIDITP